VSLQQLYQRIWLGGFPALNEQGPPARELFFRSYVQTYLQRDVPELLRVSDLLAFNRFLAATAARLPAASFPHQPQQAPREGAQALLPRYRAGGLAEPMAGRGFP
jgi:hypothetical protein